MVYCGKPSRGCQMCRTRRIKVIHSARTLGIMSMQGQAANGTSFFAQCDETKPTCKQCAKSRRQCPGYKDELDLVFRNETLATERRARKSKKPSAQSKAAPSGSGSKPAAGSSKADASASQAVTQVASALNVPFEQQAACHFVANFVLIPRYGVTRGFMDYLPAMLQSKDRPDHLKLAFNACAYASLGNRAGPGNDFRNIALANYTKALSATHKALQDPVAAKSDATLASILLFSLYENVSATRLGTLAWGSHVEGAIQLVKARGQAQLRTKVGRMLFGTVRTEVVSSTGGATNMAT